MNQVARRHSGKEVMPMWVKPQFKVIETCAEVTAYAYRK
ncbi:MAG: pyrroloquinoline quinone precursor peptide PqqA [Cohnella sp.]|nr:pyrroloquinoline quinone precursor peptide PqqA [Cohnella sp.]